VIIRHQHHWKRSTLVRIFALGIWLGACHGDILAAGPAVPAGEAAAGTPNIDWASARLVTVEMVDDRFVPDKLVFRRGVPYRLHMENSGADIHDFTAPEFFNAIAIRNPDVLERTRQDEVSLQPKEQKDLYFVAQKPGHYRLICANHDWDNMVGDITIE
jgi:uncharacterized cupredoxin-like copper-binding protein